MNVCRHCHGKPVGRPRGLCWTCYYAPGVRDLYPSDPKYSRHGLDTRGGDLPEPTDAEPGSEAKILVLCARAAKNQQLWHPDDRHLSDREKRVAGVFLLTKWHGRGVDLDE